MRSTSVLREGLTSFEREELRELKRKLLRTEQERDLLKQPRVTATGSGEHPASSVSSWRIRRLAAANSIA